MPDRRNDARKGTTDRRRSPRPPLWLNLTLLLLAILTFGVAKYQRDQILTRSAILFTPSPGNPAEVNRIREELSQMELTQSQLQHELDGRMQYIQSLRSSEFYIAVDTSRKKLTFRLGSDVVREADITIGDGRTVTTPDRKTHWTFVPVKGAFTVVGKQTDYDWPVPAWVYAMKGASAPATARTVPDGLGKYVILLPDNYVIHTPPPPDSPLAGMAKPGSIMVAEQDLAAIWPRISNQTRVYIF